MCYDLMLHFYKSNVSLLVQESTEVAEALLCFERHHDAGGASLPAPPAAVPARAACATLTHLACGVFRCRTRCRGRVQVQHQVRHVFCHLLPAWRIGMALRGVLPGQNMSISFAPPEPVHCMRMSYAMQTTMTLTRTMIARR